jgi:hypothetical protein
VCRSERTLRKYVINLLKGNDVLDLNSGNALVIEKLLLCNERETVT